MSNNPVAEYLSRTDPDKVNTALLAYLCNLQECASVTPEIATSVVRELENQRTRVKLIASENYCSLPVQLTMGNLLTDKYAEGMPNHRFYAGNENVDAVEMLAAEEARKIFGAEYANVQPHCGADANLLAYWAILTTRIETPALEKYGQTNLYKLTDDQWNELKQDLGNQRLLGLDYYSGGHLTHGYRYNVSSRMFDVHGYTVNRDTGVLDYDEIERQALELKPLILLAGYSAYPRKINFKRMREIADKAGAVFMVDMAHFAGLVAGKVFTGEFDPIPHAHVVTTTTHKTLRGPRAGMVLSTAEFADALDKGCPLVMGGPLPHVIAAKAVAFREAGKPEFKDYAKKIVDNSQALAAACIKNGLEVLTGGTDNHLFLVNVRSLGITGRQAESALHESHITLNRNSLPFDPNGPWYTSGLRIGTAAVTTLGMGKAEMEELGAIIALVLKSTVPAPDPKDPAKHSKAKYTIDGAAKTEAHSRIEKLLSRFPVYPELDLELLKAAFVNQ
ncbi:glycine hydroxymethyltransferase [Breznakiella homolactica]|uniref:Serine hydroxymethyltransferase n=1 Tax=Breznakiella homolactica TaxID=2798577 RepID=A0A7T8BAZ7_9SPIR|nr:glycine hydroxymethyltransferase [Breznakiella homolactica]QQO09891.1 glycine hydroxymethyltransferase [Breznakiella homolactica]